MSAPKDDALARAVAEHGPFPMPVGTADGDPVRGPLWSLLDWSLWGAGLGDTFREPLADVMLGAVPAEMVAQAEAVMAEFIERRRIEKTGVTVYQEQRAEVDRLRAENDRLGNDLIGANLSLWEDGREIDRLRLALKAAQRGRRQLRARLEAFEALELGTPEGRVSAKCEDAAHPVWLRDLDDMRGCPWCRVAELEAGSPWERAVAGLNALVDAGVAFHVEPDGHISAPFSDEHIEWDLKAKRWVLTHDDEDEDVPPVPAVSAEEAARAAVDRSVKAQFPEIAQFLAEDPRPGGAL